MIKPGIASVVALTLAGALLAPATQASTTPGRIYGSSGVAWGGIIMMNVDAKNVVSLSANTFGTNTKTEPNYKSDAPSVSTNGLVAIASNRDGSGMRIYVMKNDGTAIKQLTFGKDAPEGTHDLNPTISPDGKWVAFVSRRSGKSTTPTTSAQDIFLVSTSGGALRQLTTQETDGRNDSLIRVVAWSPDSKQIAYRGARAVAEPNGSAPIREVLGFVTVADGLEKKILIGDCAGGNVIDWVGNSVLYSFGGGVQGCPSTGYIVRDVTTDGAVAIPKDKTPLAAPNPGQARLSPDGRRVAYTFSNAGTTYLATVGIDGSDFVQAVAGAVAPGSWLWWAPGASVPTPAKITMKNVTIKRGAKAVQLTPSLVDKSGKVIVRAAQDWVWEGATPNNASISAAGVLRVAKDTKAGTYVVKVFNAGKEAKVKLIIK